MYRMATRELKTYADHAANAALDGQTYFLHPNGGCIRKCHDEIVNYRFCFDGALRKDGSSSAGIAAFAYWPDGSRDLLLTGGKLLGYLNSSLEAN